MADEQQPKWLNWLALTTLIFSAAATLASFKGGGYGAAAMMAQNMASDQWAFYQAKSIKQHTYDLQRELLGAQMLQASEPVQAEYKKLVDCYSKEVDRYKTEKADIDKKAREHEETKTLSQRYAKIFGIAVLYLQVTIMLSALSALLKKPFLWIVSFIPGVGGLVYFANGFLLFF